MKLAGRADRIRVDTRPTDLRERLLGRLLLIFLAGGAFAYFPSAYLSIRSGLWVVFAVDTLGIAYAGIVVGFSRRFSYRVKVFSAMLMFYLIGVALLIYAGPFGAGSLFLFAFVFLTALFAELPVIGAANRLAIVTQIAFALSCSAGLLP